MLAACVVHATGCVPGCRLMEVILTGSAILPATHVALQHLMLGPRALYLPAQCIVLQPCVWQPWTKAGPVACAQCCG